MAPQITLTYFNMRGRAEATRLAFVMGDVAFEDKRIEYSNWPEVKPKLKFGQLPILEVDGDEFSQSHAITRYAGKVSGLYPNDPLKAIKIDEIMGAVEDTLGSMTPNLQMQDKTQKEAAIKKTLDEKWLQLFTPIEKMLESSANGFVVNGELTIADLFLYSVVDTYLSGIIPQIPVQFFDQFPKIKAHRDMVANIPKIAEWNKAH